MDLIIRRHDFDIAPRLATLDQSARRLSGHLTVPRDRPGQSDRSRNCGAQRPQEHSLRPVSQRKRIWPVSKIVKHPLEPLPRIGLNAQNGEVAEWSKAHAWKVCRRGTVSRVRIPFSPPLAPAKAFSRSGCGRIFPLFSRVMREGLSTGPCAGRHGSGLSGPIFSGPHDCADLVNVT